MRLLFVGLFLVEHGVVAWVNELACCDTNTHEFVFGDLSPIPAATKRAYTCVCENLAS